MLSIWICLSAFVINSGPQRIEKFLLKSPESWFSFVGSHFRFINSNCALRYHYHNSIHAVKYVFDVWYFLVTHDIILNWMSLHVWSMHVHMYLVWRIYTRCFVIGYYLRQEVMFSPGFVCVYLCVYVCLSAG